MAAPHRDEADIFNAARQVADPAARRRYVAEACGEDRTLAERVEALLRVHDEAPTFLDYPAEEVRDLLDASAAAGPGTQIGPYKLLRLIGEGGMGTVFLAEQSEPLQRQVALKVVRPGMDSRQILARFEQERQALALTDHPHIAKVLDAGETPPAYAGGLPRPYFVMELIDGVPITAYCDRARLSIRQRLELFVPVCQAVQHAHQKGIIHRDLKPSNVLVTLYDGKAVPKVIDFGIAKATGQKLTERTLETQVGSLIGTLEYMSPEQAELGQLDVDTRSDIYSLGVLLYELLTGSTPLEPTRPEGAELLDLLRAVRESDPPRPSVRLSTTAKLPAVAASRGVEPRRLVGLVRGDLDWIVMKCLEKDRSRRYESADALARDLEHYLNNEPVEACPPSRGYRLRKFVRKYRGPVLAAGVMAVLLLGGIVGTSLGFLRAERLRHLAEQKEYLAEEKEHLAKEKEREAVKQKARAEASQQQAMDALRATTDDVIEQLLGARPALGPVEKAFLQATLKRWQTFAAEQGEGQRARAIRAEGVFRVALLRLKLGQKEEAAAAYEEAIQLYSQLAADFPAVPQYRQSLAGSHGSRGVLLADLGKRPEAEAAFRRALGIGEKLAADFPAVPEYRQWLATTHGNLGLLLAGLKKSPEAEAAYRAALKIQVKLVTDFPAVPEYSQAFAESSNNAGVMLAQSGKSRLAEALYRMALKIQEKLVAAYPDVPLYRDNLANSYNNLGMLLDGLGKRPEAEAACRKGLMLLEKLAADFPAVPGYRVRLGASEVIFGDLQRTGQQPEQALPWYARGIETLEGVLRQVKTDATAQQYLRNAHWGRAVALDDLKRHAEAAKDWDKAVELSTDPQRTGIRINRAASRVRAGHVDAALQEAEELVKVADASTLYGAARVFALAAGRRDEAGGALSREQCARRAVALLRQIVARGWNDPEHRMKKSDDLNALRRRDDFKKLLAELEKKSP
jgi:serine/threonine protein kinase/tetratricopeptide (TPR) repeat protein